MTENSLGYQLPYIRLLSKFVNPEYDCNGDLHGEAFYDACGICSGGNTGREPSNDPENCAVHSLDMIAENGSVTVPVPSDGELHNNGRIMRITAVADSGYMFIGWSGDASGTDNPLTIVMNVDKEIIANFEETYKLTVNSGSGSGEYMEGTEVDIEADSPPQGHVFDRWTGDVEPLADVDSSITTIIMPALDISVTATYITDTLSVGINIPGSDSSNLSLYPNPAASEVRLVAPGFDGEAVVSLIDINGSIVLQEMLGSDGELLISTSFLPAGTYVLRVSSLATVMYIRLMVI